PVLARHQEELRRGRGPHAAIRLKERSRLDEGDCVLLNPGDLQLGFVEETAASELDLPCRPACCELQLVLEHLACPINSGVDDAEVTLDPVGVEQQPEAACLASDA